MGLRAGKQALAPHDASLHAHSAEGDEGQEKEKGNKMECRLLVGASLSDLRSHRLATAEPSIIIDFLLIHCFDWKSRESRLLHRRANKPHADTQGTHSDWSARLAEGEQFFSLPLTLAKEETNKHKTDTQTRGRKALGQAIHFSG